TGCGYGDRCLCRTGLAHVREAAVRKPSELHDARMDAGRRCGDLPQILPVRTDDVEVKVSEARSGQKSDELAVWGPGRCTLVAGRRREVASLAPVIPHRRNPRHSVS